MCCAQGTAACCFAATGCTAANRQKSSGPHTPWPIPLRSMLYQRALPLHYPQAPAIMCALMPPSQPHVHPPAAIHTGLHATSLLQPAPSLGSRAHRGCYCWVMVCMHGLRSDLKRITNIPATVVRCATSLCWNLVASWCVEQSPLRCPLAP